VLSVAKRLSSAAVTLAYKNAGLHGAMALKAMLNKSLTRRASVPWAACGVANPRHSCGSDCGLRAGGRPLASHPDARRTTHDARRTTHDARHRGDLFSIALSQKGSHQQTAIAIKVVAINVLLISGSGYFVA
jgi:hypothetical protein